MNKPIDHQLDHQSRIYVAGHEGMVGSALMRRLQAAGYRNLIVRTHAALDLTEQSAVRAFFASERPDYVFLAAAKVGGILANDTYRADFIYQNMMIACNVIHAAHAAGIQRLLFLGSSCIYPRDCPQPIREEYLLSGPLEATNEPYAIAKIAGLKLCEAFNRQYGTHYTTVMPTNLYGPNDNYDISNSHVLPALLSKAHALLARPPAQRILEVWGSGTPRRELLHVDDLADACVFLMEQARTESIYNVGAGTDLTIHELAQLVLKVVGVEAELHFDASKPDGTPRKLLDVSRLQRLGWRSRIGLEEGIRSVYAQYRSQLAA